MSARAAARHARPAPGASAAPAVAPFNASWLLSQLRDLIGPLRGRRLCVAYSGGLDSSTLLAALAASRAQAGFRLRALHIDHGLHPDAAAWAASAYAQARRWRVRCEIIRVRIDRDGQSIEAAARSARYQALGQALAAGELLLTAHTQDDQLETLLLALLRGSGVRGLAAMGAVKPFGGTQLVRPLLAVSRAALERYARAHGVSIVHDPSNDDERFDRNFLRRQVLPSLRARWPAAAVTAARSARHLAEAQGLLERGARAALAAAADGAGLRVSALRALGDAERRNALRSWIAARGLPLPDHRRLEEIAGPLLAARADATPSVRWDGGELRRHGDRLLARRLAATPPEATPLDWDWRAQPVLRLHDGAQLALVADERGDVDLAALPCPLRVSFRQGGERLAHEHGHRALKDLLQQHRIAPWLRGAVPLLERAGRIIAVADLWLDAAYRADGGAADTHRAGGAAARARLRWGRPDGDGD